MIERYKSPLVEKIWNEQAKFNRWAQVEVAACKAFHNMGEISDEDMQKIEEAELPKVERIKEIEKETDHDVVAFVRAFCENIEGDAGRHIHKGLTSSDVCDTAQAMAMRDTLVRLHRRVEDFCYSYLKPLILKYKDTPCIGRTHGVHAEITSFGLRVAGWYSELSRCLLRIVRTLDSVSHAKLSGAVGTYSQTSPDFEKQVLYHLVLPVEPVSTQVVPRDRHAELLSTLALLGGAFERIALEIRLLQRTEVQEVREGFKKGQTGSSAMPHKRNPISSEKVCGLARLLRGNTMVAFENMALWHDRDISHSSAERIILPDSFHIVFHMVTVMEKIFANLSVFPQIMEQNIDMTRGMIYSQNILGFFLKKGKSRSEAYGLVQEAARMIIEEDCPNMLYALKKLCELTVDEIDELSSLFKPERYLKHVDTIIKRVIE